MNTVLNKIKKEDYYQSSAKIIFENESLHSIYGIINYSNNEFRLSWQSDLIEPSITFIAENKICIGIDLNFAIVDLSSNITCLNLNYFFITTIFVENSLFIVTELEILKISKASFHVLEIYGLSDIFQDFKIDNDILAIECMGNTQRIINI